MTSPQKLNILIKQFCAPNLDIFRNVPFWQNMVMSAYTRTQSPKFKQMYGQIKIKGKLSKGYLKKTKLPKIVP